jgi:hypothetical protein
VKRFFFIIWKFGERKLYHSHGKTFFSLSTNEVHSEETHSIRLSFAAIKHWISRAFPAWFRSVRAKENKNSHLFQSDHPEQLQVEEDPSLLYQIKYTIGYLKEFVSLSLALPTILYLFLTTAMILVRSGLVRMVLLDGKKRTVKSI